MALLLLGPLWLGSAAAVSVRVEINTAGLGGGAAFLDLQFAAPSGAPAASAQMGNPAGFSLANLDSASSWGLDTGQAGVIGFDNAVANDALFAVNLGGVLSFDLTLSGDVDPAQQLVSVFAVSLFSPGFAPLGAADPNTGALLLLTWVPPAATGGSGSYALSHQAAEVSLSLPAAPIPEPSAAVLFLVGGAALWVRSRRRPAGAA